MVLTIVLEIGLAIYTLTQVEIGLEQQAKKVTVLHIIICNLIYLYLSGKGRLNYAVRFHYYNFIVGCSYAVRNQM